MMHGLASENRAGAIGVLLWNVVSYFFTVTMVLIARPALAKWRCCWEGQTCRGTPIF
jgi:hypothetical protein